MDTEDKGNPIEVPPPPKAMLVIRLEANGLVNVQFPMDPMLCYGLLKMAENTITGHFQQANAPRVVQPNGLHAPHGAVKRMFG